LLPPAAAAKIRTWRYCSGVTGVPAAWYRGRRWIPTVILVGALASCARTSSPGAQAATSTVRPPVSGPTQVTPVTVAPGPTTTVPRPSARPARIMAARSTTYPGDGIWAPAGRKVGAAPAVYATTVHYSGVAIGIAWMDTARLRLALYAGTSQPSGHWSNDGSVPLPLWGSLVATMNSGFQLNQSMGGWYLDGVAAVPLRSGAASLVIYRDGSATVGEWGRDVALTPSVVAVRQNLSLLIDRGAPASSVTALDPARVWGSPFHGKVLTWRSALGVDGAGHLIYAAGPGIDPKTLAAAMVAAGARRAMELDINPAWDNFDTFTGTGATVVGHKLLPVMFYPADHFLHPFWRDFIAAFGRTA
jgi:hypothetical protein